MWWWLFPYPRNVGKDRSLWLWGLRVRWSAVCPCHAACPVRQQQFRFLTHASCRTEHAVPHARTAQDHRTSRGAGTPLGLGSSQDTSSHLSFADHPSKKLKLHRAHKNEALPSTCSSDSALRTLTPPDASILCTLLDAGYFFQLPKSHTRTRGVELSVM